MKTTTRAALAAYMYNVFAALQVGAVVPSSVYIHDYRDGNVPRWTVVAREDLGADGVRLELEDPDNNRGWDGKPYQLALGGEPRVRTCVLAFPGKVLSFPLYMSSGEPRRDRLGDLVQNAEKAGRRVPAAMEIAS